VFRADAPAGITVVNYPLMDVKVSASIMRIDPANATPLDAYRWTLGALVGILGPIEDLERYRGCLPILMWRSRNKYSYGITAALESQIRIDAFSAFETMSGSALGAPVQAFPVPASTFFRLRQQQVW